MKVLESNLEHAMKLAEEILNSSDLHDTKRLAELIAPGEIQTAGELKQQRAHGSCNACTFLRICLCIL